MTHSLNSVSLRARPLALALGGAAVLVFTGVATAGEFIFEPNASYQYVYDSNVYQFSKQVAAVTGTADTADRYTRTTTGLDFAYFWQQQRLRATAEGRRFRFEEFMHLDHDEYAIDAGFYGGILSNTTGLVNYRDERRGASFEDRRNTQLIIERDQVRRGELSVAVTPQWHVVTGARSRTLHSPLPDAPALPQPAPGVPARRASPDFTLHETAYELAVQYGNKNKEIPEAEAPLVIGVGLEHQSVGFSGVTPQPPPPPGVKPERFDGYRLLTLEVTADYAISGLSSLEGKLGATQYDSKQNSDDSKPEMTGEIGVTRRFSPLTEINGRLFRRIAPFAATADSTTNTGASVGAKWEPVLDLKILVDYSWSTNAFRGVSGIAPENAGRSDKAQIASLSFAYPFLRYFGLRIFGAYGDRRSNLEFNNYIDKTVGAEASFRFSRKPAE